MKRRFSPLRTMKTASFLVAGGQGNIALMIPASAPRGENDGYLGGEEFSRRRQRETDTRFGTISFSAGGRAKSFPRCRFNDEPRQQLITFSSLSRGNGLCGLGRGINLSRGGVGRGESHL